MVWKRVEAKREAALRESQGAGLRASAEYAAELVADPEKVALLTRHRPMRIATTQAEFNERIFRKP